MNQPGLFAWQIFDQKTLHLLRDEYRIARCTKEKADTWEELVAKMDGVDPKGFLDTIARVQRRAPSRRAVQPQHP